MRMIPPSTGTVAYIAFRRLVEVSVGLIFTAEELEKNPLPSFVAHMTLIDAVVKKGKVGLGLNSIF